MAAELTAELVAELLPVSGCLLPVPIQLLRIVSIPKAFTQELYLSAEFSVY